MAERALLGDADAPALAALDGIFRASGMTAWAISDAQAALVQACQLVPDLVVVDLHPNGLALIGELRRRAELRRTAIVAITAMRETSQLHAAFAAGADDFLFKPFAGEELLARSQVTMQRRRNGGHSETVGSSRRDITALFCDVRGFTQAAARLDPEWVVEMLNGIFEKLVQQLGAWGGHLDKFLGDGLLALFGMTETVLPKELSAIRAGLSMVKAMEEYANETLLLEGRRLGVGVGIATGEVVIAPVGAQQLRQVTAIGDAVNLASRVQGIAGEGEVLICERTFARTSEWVVTGAAREVVLKGVAGSPVVHPVLGLKGWLAGAGVPG